jgi:hypothetical protein
LIWSVEIKKSHRNHFWPLFFSADVKSNHFYRAKFRLECLNRKVLGSRLTLAIKMKRLIDQNNHFSGAAGTRRACLVRLPGTREPRRMRTSSGRSWGGYGCLMMPCHRPEPLRSVGGAPGLIAQHAPSKRTKRLRRTLTGKTRLCSLLRCLP